MIRCPRSPHAKHVTPKGQSRLSCASISPQTVHCIVRFLPHMIGCRMTYDDVGTISGLMTWFLTLRAYLALIGGSEERSFFSLWIFCRIWIEVPCCTLVSQPLPLAMPRAGPFRRTFATSVSNTNSPSIDCFDSSSSASASAAISAAP